jgi:hypothetical protein
MGGAPGGSTLGNMARRRAALEKQRKSLTGGAERGAPQAPTRANPQPPPPPSAPAQERAPAQGEPQGEAPAQGSDRAPRKEQAEGLLDAMRASVQGQVPPPRAAPIREEPLRPTPADTLTDRVDQLGAAGRSLEVQFYRLAGRAGGPLELSLLASRLELERQLKRVPTANEVRSYTANPSSLGPLFSPAVEVPSGG